MSWTPTIEQMRGMIGTYLQSPHKRGAAPARSRVRVGRVVYVTDSVAQAKRELHGADLRHALGRMQHLIPPGGSTADLTFEKLIDNGFFICGDPDTVYEGIKNVYDEVGGFGTLLVFGFDYKHKPEAWHNSLRLLKQEVMPRLKHLNADLTRAA